MVAHIEYKKITKTNTELAGCMERIPRTKPSNKGKMVFPRRQNNIKYQNSELDARPAKVKYYEKQVLMDSVKVMIRLQHIKLLSPDFTLL